MLFSSYKCGPAEPIVLDHEMIRGHAPQTRGHIIRPVCQSCLAPAGSVWSHKKPIEAAMLHNKPLIMTPRQMRAAVVHVCREATESWCVNARVVAGSRQTAIVDYNVGQWSSSANPPPPAGLFDLAVCECLLLEPSAWEEGGPKGHVCVWVCV